MVNITNGKTIILVPSGAFKEIYKKQGWRVAGTEEVENSKKPSEDFDLNNNIDNDVNNVKFNEEVSEDSDEIEKALDEKPLKEMSIEELQEYAKMNNIDIEGLTDKKEIRRAIKEAIN